MPIFTQAGTPQRLGRPLTVLVLFALLLILLMLLGHAAAQSGGGFGGSTGGSSGGGGSFGGGGYSGGGYSGGGYSGPIIVGGGFPGGYSGGGGGFGLFGLIIFALVIFAVVGFMRRSLGGGGARGLGALGGVSGTAQAVSVQLLLAEGDEVKRDLQRIAQQGDPDTNEGLARMLQEAALVLLRHPERWVYGNVERAQGAASSADSQVGAWATEARAAFTEQTTSNYQNRDPHSGYTHRSDYTFQKEAGDLYLAVTIAVAAHALGNLPPAGVTTAAEAREALMAISSVNPGDLIRAEVVWSPDAEGEFLSEDEAIRKYPKLTKL
ncbi:protein of unknown function DUF1517 [Deinococcus geothermalis DSM 11300]|uniref:DUF1517 domain-containing protein n=1 Tax=Deinococcus geothermalis (strain DSM 11300 / CIP 105573 / AG-3a) TaxID=319795 RepID=Q1IYB8_DEIGD|nr:DUF1517 domain-containing protein [Deinococcus geothermalis]ABF45766.1 protein of unknown function DUF1517 [Deinococcus geothermalis DSM 11300]